MIMSKNVHDILATLGRYILPALAVFVTSLGDIWSIAYAREIALTLTALSVFINAIVDKDTKNFLSKED